ncbi:MAG: protein kinase [Gemmatimonadetes bacterium]|nr:protein kinase [Gemmatimonadota bacterium]
MARTCPQCGKEYSDDDRFCTVDGAALISAGGANSLIGTVLADRYLVQERLGEGGMGEVYLAEHVRIKRKVAVKLMRTWMVGDPVAVSRFHREAENASQISHPNVAQVYDFGETADGMIYLAMEYVPGEPLSSILERERRLNVVRTGEMVRQTAEALVAAHGMGILHRDLKPDNIMVARTRAGTDMVKLVDFGIARVMSRGTQQFTSTGMIVGTPDYMSPEQLTGDSLDERSDLYALALIAFRVLTGESAFKSNVAGDAFIARMMGKPRTLADVLPDVAWPAALQAAFDKALAADPAARHADAMEFVAEFDGAIDQIPLNEEEQAYLLLVSQRMATPSRGGMIVDSSTPVRSMSAVRAAGGLSPTPTTGQPPVGVATPPSESQAMPRPALQPTVQLAGAAVPPVGVPPVRSETPVVPAAAADASRTTTPTPPPPASPIAARDDTQPASIVVRDATPAVPHPAVVAATPAAASPRRGPPLGVIAAAAIGVAVLGYAATRLGGGKDETAAPPRPPSSTRR